MEVFKCVQCFIGFWKDFQADQKWRFPELPPSQFKKWLELSGPGVDIQHFRIKIPNRRNALSAAFLFRHVTRCRSMEKNRAPKQ